MECGQTSRRQITRELHRTPRSLPQTRSLKTCNCPNATHLNSKTSSSIITIMRLSIYPGLYTKDSRSVDFIVANPALRNHQRSEISSTSATLRAQGIELCCMRPYRKHQNPMVTRRELIAWEPFANSRSKRCATGTTMTPQLRTKSSFKRNSSAKRTMRWTRGHMAFKTMEFSHRCPKSWNKREPSIPSFSKAPKAKSPKRACPPTNASSRPLRNT